MNRDLPSDQIRNSSIILLFLFAISNQSIYSQTGFYTLNGGSDTQTNQTFAATQTDQSAVYVLNSGILTLNNCTITKTGDSSNVNNSSQYGINAGILANSSGVITINGGSVTTNTSGGNGLFATGSGSSISMTEGSIDASGGNAHGVDVTYDGVITLTNVDVTTNGSSSSAIATDFGGGTVIVTGGTIIASSTDANSHSARIYSTGNITVSNASVTSLGDCGGVIDGANSITLTNTSLSGKLEGIKIWKTAPMSGTATVTIDGGSLQAVEGNAFYVIGETGNSASATLSVSNVTEINSGTGYIVKVITSSTATFTSDNSSLTGNFIADENSTLNINLQNGSSLTGNAQNSAINMDANCNWTVTANSMLTLLTNADGISGNSVTNITGNGNNVYYNASLPGNSYLNSQTYSLVNGGVLAPIGSTGLNETGDITTANWMLYQNYPNPFNPSTTIKYDLPVSSEVILAVFNINGQEIKSLVRTVQPAGSYEVTFNGSNLSSGIYFYRLNAGSFLKLKRCY
jgi:hypothetical protein